MKNIFRMAFLAPAIAVSMGACSGNKSGSNTDSARVDSSSKTTSDTSMKIDTVKPATDSTKAQTDTVKKVTKTTEVKKSEEKEKKK